MTEQILILDFGAQYTQVIARRVRECRVYSTIVRFDLPAAAIAAPIGAASSAASKIPDGPNTAPNAADNLTSPAPIPPRQ